MNFRFSSDCFVFSLFSSNALSVPGDGLPPSKVSSRTPATKGSAKGATEGAAVGAGSGVIGLEVGVVGLVEFLSDFTDLDHASEAAGVAEDCAASRFCNSTGVEVARDCTAIGSCCAVSGACASRGGMEAAATEGDCAIEGEEVDACGSSRLSLAPRSP